MSEKHSALFFGKVVGIRYTVQDNRDVYNEYMYHRSGYRRKPVLQKYNEFISYKQFYSCDFEKPPLEKDEKVYINELDLTVVVLDRVRSTNGEYCYYVDHVVESIENKESEKSLAEANIYLEKELERYNTVEGYEKVIAELKNKKKWYHFFKK